MGLLATAEKWLWTVAVKKIIAAIVGFLASQQALDIIAKLQAHGVNVQIDPARFETEVTLAGIGLFAMLHDWLKLKFPESKWL